MQNLTSSIPKSTCMNLQTKIAALRQMRVVSDTAYKQMVILLQAAMKKQDFSDLLKYTFAIYAEQPNNKQIGEIIDILLIQREDNTDDRHFIAG